MYTMAEVITKEKMNLKHDIDFLISKDDQLEESKYKIVTKK